MVCSSSFFFRSLVTHIFCTIVAKVGVWWAFVTITILAHVCPRLMWGWIIVSWNAFSSKPRLLPQQNKNVRTLNSPALLSYTSKTEKVQLNWWFAVMTRASATVLFWALRACYVFAVIALPAATLFWFFVLVVGFFEVICCCVSTGCGGMVCLSCLEVLACVSDIVRHEPWIFWSHLLTRRLMRFFNW